MPMANLHTFLDLMSLWSLNSTSWAWSVRSLLTKKASLHFWYKFWNDIPEEEIQTNIVSIFKCCFYKVIASFTYDSLLQKLPQLMALSFLSTPVLFGPSVCEIDDFLIHMTLLLCYFHIWVASISLCKWFWLSR